MVLKRCWECRTDVDADALLCPNCGAPAPGTDVPDRYTRAQRIARIPVVAFVLIAIVWFSLRQAAK